MGTVTKVFEIQPDGMSGGRKAYSLSSGPIKDCRPAMSRKTGCAMLATISLTSLHANGND